MSEDQKIVIVGIGDNGADSLSREALRCVSEAQVLLGGERHLTFFPDHPAEKLAIRDNLKEIAARLQNETRRVVVLASGDPLFYGGIFTDDENTPARIARELLKAGIGVVPKQKAPMLTLAVARIRF